MGGSEKERTGVQLEIRMREEEMAQAVQGSTGRRRQKRWEGEVGKKN